MTQQNEQDAKAEEYISRVIGVSDIKVSAYARPDLLFSPCGKSSYIVELHLGNYRTVNEFEGPDAVMSNNAIDCLLEMKEELLEWNEAQIMAGIHCLERNDDLPDIGYGPKAVQIYKNMIGAYRE